MGTREVPLDRGSAPNGKLGKLKRRPHDSAPGGHGPSSSPENFLRGPQENRQWDLRQRIKHPYPPGVEVCTLTEMAR